VARIEIFDFDHQLDADGRASCGAVDIGSFGGADTHAVEGEREVGLGRASLVALDNETKNANVEVSGCIEVAREDLASQ
jgi:hypothetical protein